VQITISLWYYRLFLDLSTDLYISIALEVS